MAVNKCCVLICDDPLDRAVFTRALYDVSPQTICITASNGVDALFMMNEENMIPSYIFVELNMPVMNGVEFLQAIKKNGKLKEVPVIVHSTSPQPHMIIELKTSGAMAIYFKPYEYFGICNMLTLYFGSEMATIQQN
jgi:CheY-like chemotaxis protein